MRALVLVLLLAGCASPEVRVIKPPPPPVIQVPVLSAATTPEEKTGALARYIIELKGALTEALLALDAYR